MKLSLDFVSLSCDRGAGWPFVRSLGKSRGTDGAGPYPVRIGAALAAGVAVLLLATAWDGRTSTPEAIDPGAAALERESSEWMRRNALGKRAAARGDAALALAEFSHAIAANPSVAVLYANRGGARLQAGDPKGAVADCRAALGIDPRCLEALVNRAEARKELGEWSGAADDYAAALLLLRPTDVLWWPVRERLDRSRAMARGGT